MPKFQIIQTKAELPSSYNWVESPHSYCRGRNVDEKGHLVSSTYQGRQYTIVHERVRQFSTLERVGRGFLGVLLIVGALFSKSVRNLFTKDKEKIRFGVIAKFPEEHAQGPITADMVSSIKIHGPCAETYPCQHFDGGDIYFKDGRKMQTQALNGFQIQALLRSFPDKIEIYGHDYFSETNKSILKGEKVLKYLRVVPGSARS